MVIVSPATTGRTYFDDVDRKRAFIPKPDGRQRPLGVTALEDKIAQRSTVEVMNAIYETDFLCFSYGFRPGRRGVIQACWLLKYLWQFVAANI